MNTITKDFIESNIKDVRKLIDIGGIELAEAMLSMIDAYVDYLFVLHKKIYK